MLQKEALWAVAVSQRQVVVPMHNNPWRKEPANGERFSSAVVNATVWHVLANVAKLHRQSPQIEKPSHLNFGELRDSF